MPYTWVESPVFTRRWRGTWTIYHAYRDNNADDSLMQYWYGVDPDLGEILYFDVRDLPPCKHGIFSAVDVAGVVPERRPHALRIFSAMLDPTFDFQAWLKEHGTPEGEL